MESPDLVRGRWIQKNALLVDPLLLARSTLARQDLEILYCFLARSADKIRT